MFTIGYELTTLRGTGVSDKREVLPSELSDVVARYFNDAHTQFVVQMEKVFRRTLYEGLIYLLRRTPVDTGRLRGSFSTYFQRHGQMARAARVADRPALNSDKGGNNFDQAEFERGMSQDGSVTEEPFNVTIGSNVEYGPSVEMRQAFLAETMMFLADRFKENTIAYIDLARKKGYIPEVDENEANEETT